MFYLNNGYNHPSIVFPLSEIGSQGQRVQEETPRHLSPQRHPPAHSEGSQGVPRPDGIYIVPSASSGLSPGSPPSGTCTKNIQREAPGRHPDRRIINLLFYFLNFF
ncbi:hypothetical protein ATANTOWER_023373 [Ataeniobius toweri]|uniref:Uncharacterized protein n=1 Tax=Ataeniobius toweri TaxID=208326 RepID=A0ABU7C1I4_9TELE|nr:hypothetical protein [Ataeniobius toweri]